MNRLKPNLGLRFLTFRVDRDESLIKQTELILKTYFILGTELGTDWEQNTPEHRITPCIKAALNA